MKTLRQFSVLEQLESRTLMTVSVPSVAGSDIVYDSSGKLDVAYYDTSAHALKFAATASAGATTLGTPTTIASFNATDLTGEIAAAIDPSGKPAVAFYDPSSSSLKYAHFDGSTWDITTVGTKENAGPKPSLAFDKKGHALISYYQQSKGHLNLAVQTKGGFENETFSRRASSAVASAVGYDSVTGKKILAYQNRFGQIVYNEVVTHHVSSPVMTHLSAGLGFGLIPQWQNSHETNHMPTQETRFVHRQIVDNISQIGTSLSMTFDTTGKPMFSYYDPKTGTIKLATGNGNTFSTQSVGTVTAGVDPQANVVDSGGKPTVIYYSSSVDGLFAATLNGTTFTTKQLSTGGKNVVAALNKDGSIGYTVFDATTKQLSIQNTNATPALPTNLSATATAATQVSLSWTDNSSNEASFRIERSTDGTTFTTLASPAANATSYTDTTAAEGTSYYYRIFAVGADGSSTLGTVKAGSGTGNKAQVTTLPAAATNLTAATVTPTSIKMTWTDVSHAETGYKIERSTNGGTSYTILTTAAANTTQYVDSNLTEGTNYIYRVTPINAGGIGISTTGTFTTMPLAPSSVTATVVSSTKVNVTWPDTSTHETAYIVERSTNGGTSFTQIASLSAGATTYSDTSAPANTTLIYRVKAVTNTVSSAYATATSVTTPA